MTTNNIVNKTPHPVIWVREDGEKVTFPPNPPSLRTKEIVSGPEFIGGEIPLVTCRMERPAEGELPPTIPGTWYIVSAMVASLYPERPDFITPDTGPESVIRDPDGRIVGVKRFRRLKG
jgi:hypothetical protein